MPASQWHKFYISHVAAAPGVLFGLLADMPDYGRWLPAPRSSTGPPTSSPTPSGWTAAITTGNRMNRAKTGGAP